MRYWLPDEIEPETGIYCPRCGHGQHIPDGGMVLDSAESEPDVASDHADTEIEHVEEKTQLDTVELTLNAIVTETVTPDDPAALPDFDVYCSAIDASQTTVSRLVEQEVSA